MDSLHCRRFVVLEIGEPDEELESDGSLVVAELRVCVVEMAPPSWSRHASAFQ